ncbi:NifB/NifX family molybdenum-iron cluster-binding protein [Candidatus Hydrogenedentota bacterium]
MKTAIPEWKGRVSPVFDTATCLVVIETNGRSVVDESRFHLVKTHPLERARELAGLGIDLLICGGISRDLTMLIHAYGTEVLPSVIGDTREVLAAYLSGQLSQPQFRMPGCSTRNRRRWGTRESMKRMSEEVRSMPRGDGTGPQEKAASKGEGLGARGSGKTRDLARGPGKGRGQGRGRGTGKGQQKAGRQRQCR